MPLQTGEDVGVEISELMSIRFINKPDRIRLLTVKGDGTARHVEIENEVNERKILKAGAYTSGQTGWVEQIGDDYFVSRSRLTINGRTIFTPHFFWQANQD